MHAQMSWKFASGYLSRAGSRSGPGGSRSRGHPNQARPRENNWMESGVDEGNRTPDLQNHNLAL